MAGGPERWLGSEGPGAEDLERWWRAAEGAGSFEGMIFELRDGTRVRVRPLDRRDDAGAADLERRSPEARHVRLMSEVARMDEPVETAATESDAWVALDADVPGRVLGVARYVATDDAPRVADLAVTIADSHRGRGLGCLLIAYLSRSALRHGIERFRVHVLPANPQSIHLLHEAGARLRATDGDVLRFDVRVVREPAHASETHLGRVLRTMEGIVEECERRPVPGAPIRIPTCA